MVEYFPDGLVAPEAVQIRKGVCTILKRSDLKPEFLEREGFQLQGVPVDDQQIGDLIGRVIEPGTGTAQEYK